MPFLSCCFALNAAIRASFRLRSGKRPAKVFFFTFVGNFDVVFHAPVAPALGRDLQIQAVAVVIPAHFACGLMLLRCP